MDCVDVHAGLGIDAEISRPFGFRANERHRLLDAEIGRGLIRRQRCGFTRASFALLQERTVAADAHTDGFARLRIDADVDEGIVGGLVRLLHRVFQSAMVLVAAKELPDEIEPVALAARNLIEILLHLRRERDVDEIVEVPAQEARDGEGRVARDQRLALTEHVPAALDRADRRSVGRRTPDAEPFELFDQRRLRVARRRRRIVTLRLERNRPDACTRVALHQVADRQLRQDRLLLLELRRRIVAAFDIGAAEAGELDRLAGRGERRRFGVDTGAGDLDRRAQDARVHHLRRHRALPDQLVDAQVVPIEGLLHRGRRAAEVRGSDRFVRFLRVLHLGRVAPRARIVLAAEHRLNRRRRLPERLVAQRC